LELILDIIKMVKSEPKIITFFLLQDYVQISIEKGYFEYGNFEFENGNFEKQSGELKTKWGTKS